MEQPTKEQVRQWQLDRRVAHTPPPDPAQIRRALGWHLIAAERASKR